MKRMGKEKLYFPHLKALKRHNAPLGQTVSTHFVADCGFMGQYVLMCNNVPVIDMRWSIFSQVDT